MPRSDAAVGLSLERGYNDTTVGADRCGRGTSHREPSADTSPPSDALAQPMIEDLLAAASAELATIAPSVPALLFWPGRMGHVAPVALRRGAPADPGRVALMLNVRTPRTPRRAAALESRPPVIVADVARRLRRPAR